MGSRGGSGSGKISPGSRARGEDRFAAGEAVEEDKEDRCSKAFVVKLTPSP